MGVGKYSPTVSYSYRQDQDWWEKNGGDFGNGKDPNDTNDDEGYDAYGYSGPHGTGPDRAGITEDQYASHSQEYGDGDRTYYLYERVRREWERLLCGTQHASKYPVITGIVSDAVRPTYVIISTITRELDDTVTHGTVGSEKAAEDLVKQLNDRSHRQGPRFYYEEISPITATVDEIYQAAAEAG